MYGFFSEADELPYAGLDAVQGLYDIAIEGGCSSIVDICRQAIDQLRSMGI